MKKKAIVGGSILLFIALSSIYLLIPSDIHVSQIQNLPVPPGALIRCFNNSGKMKDWWPRNTMIAETTATYNGYSFKFSKFNITEVQKVIIYDNNNDSLNSSVSVTLSGRDSSFLYWNCDLKTTLSPVNRIRQYLKAIEIKKAITKILGAFSAYTANTTNIYGISIRRGKVTDSVLISEKKELPVYPGVPEIYSSINSLKQYIVQQRANQVDSPICNITPKVNGGFALIVAIPINKTIKENEIKKIKTLMYNGNQLITEVKGGDYTINKALKSLDNYISDYQLTPAVLPYLSLLTDREKVTDSSKWITKICYPIY
ncbi:MAG: hypothetical protein WDO19_20695 [Bacteroidota bacterium]